MASESLYNLIDEVWKRVKSLKAGFTCVFIFLPSQTYPDWIFGGNSQQRLDLDAAFEFFCNGLYGKVFWVSTCRDIVNVISDDFYTEYLRDNDDCDEEDSEDSGDEESNDEDVAGEDGEAGEEGGSGDESDEADGSVRASSPATTVPEEVVPLSVELLRYPAKKAEKDVIDAQKCLYISNLFGLDLY